MSVESEKVPTSINDEGIFEPFHIDHVPWKEFFRGERFGMRYPHLSSFGGGTQISLAMEVLPAGRQANQSHYHMLAEEHVFILEGNPTLQLGARTFELSPGHCVCFAAGQKVAHGDAETVGVCPVVLFSGAFGSVPEEVRKLLFNRGALAKRREYPLPGAGMRQHGQPRQPGEHALRVRPGRRGAALHRRPGDRTGRGLSVSYNATGGGPEASVHTWFERIGVDRLKAG